VNGNWLLTGKGDMFLNEANNEVNNDDLTKKNEKIVEIKLKEKGL